ncbi:MAG: hypothetical protein AAF721_12865 [Myxococcota bacterium]
MPAFALACGGDGTPPDGIASGDSTGEPPGAAPSGSSGGAAPSGGTAASSEGDGAQSSGGAPETGDAAGTGDLDTGSTGGPPTSGSDWEDRASAPGVLMATRFDTESEVTDWLAGATQDHVSWQTTGQASGAGCMRFDILATDGAASGDWSRWLSDDEREFSTGDEFYVSFRQYIPSYYAQHEFVGGGGWKQSIISRHAASMNGVNQMPPYGSNQLYEVVLVNARYYSIPQGYNRNRAGQFRGWDLPSANNCSGSDFRLQAAIDHGGPEGNCAEVWARYGGLYSYYSQQGAPNGRPNPDGGEVPYFADEWMSFKVRIVVGTFETSGNAADWANDTLIQVWAAGEGADDWTLIHDRDPALGLGVSIGEDSGGAYDALWLLPYDTGKQPDPSREDTYTLYDEVIVSLNDIAVP